MNKLNLQHRRHPRKGQRWHNIQSYAERSLIQRLGLSAPTAARQHRPSASRPRTAELDDVVLHRRTSPVGNPANSARMCGNSEFDLLTALVIRDQRRRGELDPDTAAAYLAAIEVPE